MRLDLPCGCPEPGLLRRRELSGQLLPGRRACPQGVARHGQCLTTPFSHLDTKAVPHVGNSARYVWMEGRNDKMTRSLVALPTWNRACLWVTVLAQPQHAESEHLGLCGSFPDPSSSGAHGSGAERPCPGTAWSPVSLAQGSERWVKREGPRGERLSPEG